MSTEFTELLDRACGGDRDAMAGLVLPFEGQLRRGLAPEWQNYQSAVSLEDVLQVTYEKAMLHLHSFAGQLPQQWAAWLATIARNTLQDMYRALKREFDSRESAHDRAELRQLVSEVIAKDSLPPSRAATGERAERLRLAVPKLPEIYRVVIELELQEKTPAEIASILGCSRPVVYARRKVAMDLLREILGQTSLFFST